MSKTFQVQVGSDSTVAAGVYPATFTEFVDLKEGEHGPYYTFRFEGEDGKKYVGFVDEPKGPPRVGENGNKLGRFLAGLAGKPPTEGFSNTPDDYIGKRYLLIFGPNKKGNISLSSFTPIK